MDVKKRTMISYDRLSIEQKKDILRDFPEGYVNFLTDLKLPNGEEYKTLLWETDEMIYLIKFPKSKAISADDDDDDDEDDDEIGDEIEGSSDDEEEEEFDD